MRRSSLLLLGVSVILAAGCGGTGKHASGASSSTGTTPVTTTNDVIVDSTDVIDGTQSPPTPPRPPAPDKRTIAWSEAKRLIAQCQVREIFQAHSLYVELQLKGGGKRNTREPRIDEVLDLLRQAESRCGAVGAMVE